MAKNFPLLPAKRVHNLFFPKLNTTVKIHRAQRIHICSTRYTLYKLDMYNSTECLNPRGSPTTKSVSVDKIVRAREELVEWCSILHSGCSPVHFAVRTGTVKMKIKARVDEDYPANLFLDSFHFQLRCTSFMFTQGLSPPAMEIWSGLFLLGLHHHLV